MNKTTLIQALHMTTGPGQNEINMAEQYLAKAREIEGYLPSLLVVACDKEQPLYIRQIAVIAIKNDIDSNWAIKNDGINKISEIDRNSIKDNLLHALINCVEAKKVRVLFEKIILTIAEHDFPLKWPNFLANTVNTLKNTTDFNTIYGCLLAFKMLVKNYEFELDKKREPLEQIIQACFGLLEQFGQALLSNYDEKAALAMNCILKTFYYTIHLKLSKYFCDPKIISTWMLFLKLILEKPMNPESEMPTMNTEEILSREKDINWNNKKWCGRILQKFFQKYGNHKYEETENTGFAEDFQKNYAVGFLELFVQILNRRKTHFVALKCSYFAVKCLYYAIRISALQKLLEPHLEDLMITILLPMLYITEKDENDWKNDPIEYLRREEDFSDQTNNIKNIALDFIEAICKTKNSQGTTYLMNLMQYAANVLSTNIDPVTKQPTDLRLKESLLHAIGILRSSIVKNKIIKQNIETLLEKFVICDFNHEVGFLRARACWLFGEYGEIEFKNKNNIIQAVEGLYKCLLDEQLPVRVKASVGLNCLLGQNEAIELIKPHLGKILEIYLGLMDKIDSEGVVSALEGIVDSFQDQIAPFAFDLIDRLVTAFFKFNQNSEAQDDNDDDPDDETELAASGCLIAIKTILNATLPQELYYRSEDLIIPVLNYTLSEEGCDYIDDGLAILNSILYNVKIIDDKMWNYFPVLNYILAGKPKTFISNIDPETLSPDKKLLLEQTESGWGYEYIQEMMGSLQNYIQKGQNVLLVYKDPAFGLSYIELLFKSIDKIIQIHGNGTQDLEMVIVSTLYICIIENYVGMIDMLIPYIIDKCMEYLVQGKTKNFKKVQIEIIAITIWYNPKLALGYLTQKNYLEAYFKTLIEGLPLFQNDFEKRRILFGLSSLLKVNVQELPPIIVNSLTGLIHEMVKMTTELLELREKDDSDDGDDEEDDEDQLDPSQIKKDDSNKNANEEEDDDDDSDYDEELEWNKKSQLYYSSPLESMCEILYFKECFELMKRDQTFAFEQLVGCLSQEEQLLLQKNWNTAYEQELEVQKKKLEKN